MLRLGLVIVVAIWIAATGGRPALAEGYKFDEIRLPDGDPYLMPVGIDDDGKVLLTATYRNSDEKEHLLYYKGKFTKLDVMAFNYENVHAMGMNNKGQVIGVYARSGGLHSFVLTNGVVDTVECPGLTGQEQENGKWAIVKAINDRGWILCFCQGGMGSNYIFLKRERSIEPFKIHYFNYLNLFKESLPDVTGINISGDIVGSYLEQTVRRGGEDTNTEVSRTGFIMTGGLPLPIKFPGASWTLPRGINNAGFVFGTAVGRTSHGFIWKEGRFTQIDHPGSTITDIVSMNNNGVLVGLYMDPNKEMFARYRVFIATP